MNAFAFLASSLIFSGWNLEESRVISLASGIFGEWKLEEAVEVVGA